MASSAQPLQVWLDESEKRGVGLNVITGSTRVTLDVGLLKPRRGFTLVAGEENLDVGKFYNRLTRITRKIRIGKGR
jgi:hypothetical protein